MIDPHARAGSIRRDLLAIRDHYDAALDATRSADESGVRGESRREPVALRILDARTEALRDLISWTNFILMEVNGGTIEHGPQGGSIDRLAEFVGRWCQAICEQLPDDADNLEREMRHHADALKALALGWTVKRIEVGRCPEQTIIQRQDAHARDVEVFEPCTGTLWAILRSRDELLSKEVACDGDGAHVWLPWQWRALGHRLGTLVGELQSTAAMEASEHEVSISTIRRRRARERGA